MPSRLQTRRASSTASMEQQPPSPRSIASVPQRRMVTPTVSAPAATELSTPPLMATATTAPEESSRPPRTPGSMGTKVPISWASSETRVAAGLGTAGDRGHDAELVARIEGRLQTPRGPDVVIVPVDVDEVAQPTRRLEDPRPEARVAPLQIAQGLGHGGAIHLHLRGASGQLPKGTGNPHLDAHFELLLTQFSIGNPGHGPSRRRPVPRPAPPGGYPVGRGGAAAGTSSATGTITTAVP